MQRLALAPVVVGAGLRREHQLERLEDVLARLFPRVTLTEDTGHLGDRGDDPAVFARLIDDRQIEFANHGRNDSAKEGQCWPNRAPEPWAVGSPRPPAPRRSARKESLVRSEPRPDLSVAGLASVVAGGAHQWRISLQDPIPAFVWARPHRTRGRRWSNSRRSLWMLVTTRVSSETALRSSVISSRACMRPKSRASASRTSSTSAMPRRLA